MVATMSRQAHLPLPPAASYDDIVTAQIQRALEVVRTQFHGDIKAYCDAKRPKPKPLPDLFMEYVAMRDASRMHRGSGL
jgi:hypothetical protein